VTISICGHIDRIAVLVGFIKTIEDILLSQSLKFFLLLVQNIMELFKILIRTLMDINQSICVNYLFSVIKFGVPFDKVRFICRYLIIKVIDSLDSEGHLELMSI